MTSEGHALSRFRRALAARNGSAAYAAASELPNVELADALALTLLSPSVSLAERVVRYLAATMWSAPQLSFSVDDLPPG